MLQLTQILISWTALARTLIFRQQLDSFHGLQTLFGSHFTALFSTASLWTFLAYFNRDKFMCSRNLHCLLSGISTVRCSEFPLSAVRNIYCPLCRISTVRCPLSGISTVHCPEYPLSAVRNIHCPLSGISLSLKCMSALRTALIQVVRSPGQFWVTWIKSTYDLNNF